MLPRPEVRSLYDWALSRCLGGAAKDAGDRDDAYKTAGAYLERSEVESEVYEKIQPLIDAVSARTYGGSVPGEYRTMKCIDLYESEELQRLIGGATK